MRNHLAPVPRPEHRPQRLRNRLGRHGAAANRSHLEAESQLQRDLLRIARQNGERAGADIAQAHDTHVHFLHMGIMACALCGRGARPQRAVSALLRTHDGSAVLELRCEEVQIADLSKPAHCPPNLTLPYLSKSEGSMRYVPALVTAFLLAVPLSAGSIGTYIFTGTASGTAGSASFTGLTLTIPATGDIGWIGPCTGGSPQCFLLDIADVAGRGDRESDS